MKWWVEYCGRRQEVSVSGDGHCFAVRVDGNEQPMNLLPVAANLAAVLREDGRSHFFAHQRLGPGRWRIFLADKEFVIQLRNLLEREVAQRGAEQQGLQEIRAPIPGKVVRLVVQRGDEVAAGQPLLVLEAMKMENPICAEGAGRVRDVLVQAGATVEGGQLLVVLH